MSDSKKDNLIFRFLSLLLIILFVFAFACSKRNEIKWVNYEETSCADPWPFNVTNEILKENIIEYFKKKDVTIYDLEIFIQKDPEAATTCTAKTGRVIHCKIKNRDLTEMKSRGFYE